MDERIKIILENNGWDIECESPLEIRHVDSESFATGWAAEIVIDYLTSHDNDENSN